MRILLWLHSNVVLIASILVFTGMLLVGAYIKGRSDEKLAAVTTTKEVTVKSYETERKINKKIRNADFDSVLDLNDSMYGKPAKK